VAGLSRAAAERAAQIARDAGAGSRSTDVKYRILLTFLLAAAAVAPGMAQPKTDVSATLKALEEKWAAAQVKADTATMESLLADTFVYTTIDGVLRSKQDMVREVKAGTLKITSAKVDDIKVNVYGDAAVVTGRWQGKGVEDGKPFDDTERWTDTWVRIKGEWRCVASQSTLLMQ
jgi:ketosteroid isomerase-like protein